MPENVKLQQLNRILQGRLETKPFGCRCGCFPHFLEEETLTTLCNTCSRCFQEERTSTQQILLQLWNIISSIITYLFLPSDVHKHKQKKIYIVHPICSLVT